MVTTGWVLVLTVVACCHKASATNDCAITSCMEGKIDFDEEIRDRINVTRSSLGIRIYFKPKLFSFLCSAFDMVQTCISGLNSTELNECVPKKEQKEFSAVMGAMDRIVCTKDERLDTLVDCMNDGSVQKMFFVDLMFKGFSFMKAVEEKDSNVCSDIKTEFSKTVTSLSATCDNDGLRALLEIMNELVVEFEDEIVDKIPKRLSRDNICLDEFKEVTKTAQTPLSRRALAMKTSRIIRSVLGY
ncbi:uncharacterized protein LOC125654741 [Ostrea edulis]|uniref:uncharacterized protein LOC125654741 n=1 Tax=Ostrea edulis TaxID=37623 RepID=UPI0024AEFF5D|nr:uncharacterized protein LOC125654741 [Ostrea edulis]